MLHTLVSQQILTVCWSHPSSAKAGDHNTTTKHPKGDHLAETKVRDLYVECCVSWAFNTRSAPVQGFDTQEINVGAITACLRTLRSLVLDRSVLCPARACMQWHQEADS